MKRVGEFEKVSFEQFYTAMSEIVDIQEYKEKYDCGPERRKTTKEYERASRRYRKAWSLQTNLRKILDTTECTASLEIFFQRGDTYNTSTWTLYQAWDKFKNRKK